MHCCGPNLVLNGCNKIQILGPQIVDYHAWVYTVRLHVYYILFSKYTYPMDSGRPPPAAGMSLNYTQMYVLYCKRMRYGQIVNSFKCADTNHNYLK